MTFRYLQKTDRAKRNGECRNQSRFRLAECFWQCVQLFDQGYAIFNPNALAQLHREIGLRLVKKLLASIPTIITLLVQV